MRQPQVRANHRRSSRDFIRWLEKSNATTNTVTTTTVTTTTTKATMATTTTTAATKPTNSYGFRSNTDYIYHYATDVHMDHKIWAGSEENHVKRNSDAAFHLYARLNITSAWRSADGHQHLLKVEVRMYCCSWKTSTCLHYSWAMLDSSIELIRIAWSIVLLWAPWHAIHRCSSGIKGPFPRPISTKTTMPQRSIWKKGSSPSFSTSKTTFRKSTRSANVKQSIESMTTDWSRIKPTVRMWSTTMNTAATNK